MGDHRWPELASDDARLLLVPIGSCEQHGPHLPLCTDTLVAEAVAAAVAADRPDALVAPSVGVAASGEHQGFPGTLSVGTAIMTAIAVEISRSALPEPVAKPAAPFAAVLFLNAHGGNADALAEAERTASGEGRRVAVWHAKVDGADLHAGDAETSLMLHLHPDRVSMELAKAGPPADLPGLQAALRRYGVSEVSPNGVLGDPRAATADKGAELFSALVASAQRAAVRLLGSPSGT